MKTGAVSLVLSAIALGVAGFTLTESPSESRRAPARTDRVAALERQVSDLAREVEFLKADRPDPIPRDSRDDTPRREDDAPGLEVLGNDTLTAIVDDAVERKAKQFAEEMAIKADKKPEIRVFSKMLELTPEQRAITERTVREGQLQVHEILNVPTQNGVNLMDELVEIVAKGYAQPGKDHGWGRWIQRVLSETIPGTDQTYGASIESIKRDMRTKFKREWSEAQYREFEAWKVDPTEIKDVPDSPNIALAERIKERARALGAVIPNDK